MSHRTTAKSSGLTVRSTSTLESVDQAESDVTRIAGEAGFDEEDLHRIGIAVRESMVNAVVHGNHYSTKKKVRFAVSHSVTNSDSGPPKDCLAVVIEDEGEGFHQKEVPDPLAEENLLRHSGRDCFSSKHLWTSL